MSTNQTAIREFLETWQSLNTALNQAGGVSTTPGDIERMSAVDLIALIAPNSIRFEHVKVSLKKEVK